VRVVALSGGYTQAEADVRLRKNHGVVASFSRALMEGLSVHQTDEARQFDKLTCTGSRSAPTLDAALRIAKMMEKAYNFENDRNVSIIKNTYSGAIRSGLLASDALMADIQSFTEDLLFNTQSKKQVLQTTICLAERYGYQFETQLRRTGNMKFATTLDDFDETYPGTYGGRIIQVSVSLEGIVPPTGVTGTLTNSGISIYRRPTDPTQLTTLPPPRVRIQNGETAVDRPGQGRHIRRHPYPRRRPPPWR
jgi:hypothetical protein